MADLYVCPKHGETNPCSGCRAESDPSEPPDRIFINPATAARHSVDQRRIGDVEYIRLSPASAAPVVDNEATQECAREISDLIWGEAKKLAQSFVDANIRNYNDHKGVESLERVYDAKRDTAQQIVNQMHNFREARWRKPKDVEAIISKHFAAPVAQSEDQ